jgi:hypothetical protein
VLQLVSSISLRPLTNNHILPALGTVRFVKTDTVRQEQNVHANILGSVADGYTERNVDTK